MSATALLPNHLRPRREKVFGHARGIPLDGNAKARLQQLAAVRMMFNWLITGQITPVNPAAAVRGPKLGNFQAWLALPGMEDKDFARRLRKGTGADTTASGATRVAGSLNFKEKYAPNFPRVAIQAAQPGRQANRRGFLMQIRIRRQGHGKLDSCPKS